MAIPPSLATETVAQINAQRQANGKRQPLNLLELRQEAQRAGISLAEAAAWILAKPGRNFFRAEYHQPVPITTPPSPKPHTPPSSTPPSKDPALQAWDAQAKQAVPPPAAVRAKLAELRAQLVGGRR